MNVFELFATLGIDTTSYDKGLSNAESAGSSFASSVGSVITTGVGAAVTAATTAVTAAATGIATLTTQAVQSYGTYEQLVGGVEKIFGDSADAVLEYANQAYQTAGLSANSYMETVTSFSASLLQGLEGDTELAAQIADTAIRDMSDNANTYGTDISSIQNAYMGFAKGNYTMLDNLKLGYGGTQSEMVRLINDSGILEEEIENLDDITFDQMIEAIHVVQGELNITGTTANEAAGTIQGTAGSLQAAWDNLITGLGDSNADLGSLIDNVVSSALQMVENIKPIALQAIEGIASLVEQVAPILAEELPTLIESILPSLVDAIVLLIDSVSSVLPSLVSSILPSLLSALSSVIVQLVKVLPSIMKILSSQLPVILSSLIPAILSVLPDVISAGIEIIMAIASAFADNIDLLLDAIMQVIHVLIDNILTADNLSQFLIMVNQIILTITESLLAHLPELLGAFIVLLVNVFVALAEALPSMAADLIGAIVELGNDIGDLVFEAFGTTLLDLSVQFAEWVSNFIASAIEFGTNLITNIAEFEADCIEGVANFTADIIEFFVNLASDLTSNVSNAWNGIVEFFTNGIEDAKSLVSDGLENIKNTFFNIFENVKTTVENAINYVKGLFNFEWSLPDIKLPHFSVTGSLDLLATPPTLPTVSVEWYAKAMSQPYLLDDATIFGASGGRLLGGGETGAELVYGHDQLLNDIAAVVDAKMQSIQFEITAPIYIGGKKIDQQVILANARNDVISGGR